MAERKDRMEVEGSGPTGSARGPKRWWSRLLRRSRSGSAPLHDGVGPTETDYKELFDAASDAIFVHEIETGRILDVNRKALEIYGWTADQVRRIEFSNFCSGIPPHTPEMAKSWLERAVVEGPQLFEWHARDMAGHTFWVEVGLKKVTLGGAERVLAIVRDITDRKDAEANRVSLEAERARRTTAEAAETRVKEILESISDAFLTMDDAGRFTYVNSEAERLLGAERENLLGRSYREVVPGVVGSDIETEIATATRGRTSATIEQYYEPLDAYLRIRAYRSDGLLTLYVQDVSRRKRAERALWESEERHKRLVESLNDWIWEIDEKGCFTYSSPGVRQILGYEPEQILGRYVLDFVGERYHESFLEIMASHEPIVGVEFVAQHVLGHSVFIETNASPVFDSRGRFRGYRGIDRNVMSRKRVDRIERELQGLCHDLRSPLPVITGHAVILREILEAAGIDPDALKSVGAIGRAVEKMARMIDQLTATIEAEAERDGVMLDDVHLESLLEELFEHSPLSRDAPRLEIDVAPGLPLLRADPSRLERVLLNLVSNALKYSPEGEIVSIRARVNEDMALISVIDQGPGIAPEEMPYIFERFYRSAAAKGKGLGLGLFIARTMVEAHGGRIWAECRAEGGCAFNFTIPLASTREVPEEGA